MFTLKSYIKGAWCEGTGAEISLVNPANGETIGSARATDGLDMAGALAHARDRGGPALRAMTFAERGAMLDRLTKALRDAREPLLDLSVDSCGTTRSDAKFDVDGAIFTMAHYTELATSLGERTILVEGEGEKLARSPRFCGYHIKLPRRGVAVHINAFNFPTWGMAEKAAVALLAGVPVISKPATCSALLAQRAMEALLASGALPEGAWQFIGGGVGDLLDHLDGQDMLAFTGSADTAAKLRSLPAVVERSVRINVEADSLNAAVLGESAEDDTYQRFLRDVVKEITQKTGQKCTATRRIFVPRETLDRVQADLAERIAVIKVGDPHDESVRMGPLANARQLADVRAGIERLQAAGATIVVGGGDVDPVGGQAGEGFYAAATLLRAEDARGAAAVHVHEVFGPVATLLPYDDPSEVPPLVALGGGSLLCTVYSDDRAFGEQMVLELAPHHGRVLLCNAKVAEQIITPGTVLPSCIHGGPGRAGGGEELGGLRGLDFYLQRTVIQGDRGLLDRVFGLR